MLTVKEIPLFHGLAQSDLKAVEGCLREKTFEKGAILFMEGAGCERIFIVREGRVKLYRTSSAGREQILETLEAGDTCACNPGNNTWFCNSTAEAATPCKVWFLSRNDYVRMVQNNAKLAHTLTELFARKIQCFSNLIEEVTLKDVKKRLVKFLLDIHAEKKRKLTGTNAIDIPFTREEIAQRLGTSRETIARYLSELHHDKLIDLKPAQIIIRNKESLERLLEVTS